MGKVFAVGLGPGKADCMTGQAMKAIEISDKIFGYDTYVGLIRDEFPEKEFVTTGMGSEKERCMAALEDASGGKTVCMVSGGDAGIYGMAGLIEELAFMYENVETEVIPGISAAVSGAAVLGAPLMNDFCVVSLSDHLTPWEMIEKRLTAAAKGDFVICIYNPMSKQRPGHLKKAADILLKIKPEDTVCGWVKNIGRSGQEKKLCSLAELRDEKVDMFTTVFVGNSFTKTISGKMVTLRGY
ncbi:MAG: precorrin-3B C(17)-methyltransferase [Lachnospiraceae bacterium]|nr:precorrin-3B C(17)-methyltransferase [Lachnospiraceae bacterium]MBR1875683.1 precorrin-3B C(17)-methyltransferase [Lachnospiraceae bacterium]